MYDVDDFLRQSGAELQEYAQHQRQFEGLIRDNESRLAELRQRLSAAAAQLGQVVLPQPSEANLAALADRLGLPGLRSAAAEFTTRRQAVAARIAEIEADPLYRERALRKVRLGAQLDEAQPLFDYARAELQKLEALEGMRELVEERWGTPEYEHQGWLRFFNREFLEDWRRSDQIIEALKVSDFSEAAARFKEKLEQAEVFSDTVERIQRELNAIQALEQEREAKLAEQEGLPAAMQQRAGEMLGQMLQSRGKESVRSLPEAEQALRAFAVVDGVEHQTQYLHEMNGRIRGDLSQLLERSGKLREEAGRYQGNRHRYRNKQFTREQFGKRFGRTERYSKIHQRYHRGSETVYHFHQYDRGANWNDFLWWDLITDGRLDGNWIPEVAEWRHHHPDYAYSSYRDSMRHSHQDTTDSGFLLDSDDS